MATRKKRKQRKNTTYKKEDFDSNDGMLTTDGVLVYGIHYTQ